MSTNHERNTCGFTESTKKKVKACQDRVDKAIQDLIKEKGKINFNSVAERAHVSKKYLYDNHFDRINELRRQQEGLPSPKQVKREMTDASKDVLIVAKTKRIKALEDEVRRLKGVLERRYGEDYAKS